MFYSSEFTEDTTDPSYIKEIQEIQEIQEEHDFHSIYCNLLVSEMPDKSGVSGESYKTSTFFFIRKNKAKIHYYQKLN